MSGYSEGGASPVKKTLKSWLPLHLSAKRDIDYNLQTLRARAHDLAINSALGSAVIETFTSGVIGSGLKLFPRVRGEELGLTNEKVRRLNRQIKREFELWAGNALSCDYLRRNNFYEIQRLVYQSSLVDGDSFILFRRRIPTEQRPYTLRLQAIEGLRVSNPQQNVEQEYRRHRIVNGIELNREGALEAIWIANRCYREFDSSEMKWQRVRWYGRETGCRNVLHICKDTRPDQARGVPLLSPVIESLKQLARYSDAELSSAIVKSFFSLFFTQPASNFNLEEITGEEIDLDGFRLDSPSIASLPRGVDVKVIDSASAQSTFQDFTTSFIKQIAAAVNLPFEVLLKNFQSSYSASRAALLQAENEFRIRREGFIHDFLNPIYEQFMIEAAGTGRLALDLSDPIRRAGYLNAEWIAQKNRGIDEVKEANASVIRLEHGLTTYERELAEHGLDFDDILERRQQEAALNGDKESDATRESERGIRRAVHMSSDVLG